MKDDRPWESANSVGDAPPLEAWPSREDGNSSHEARVQ
jgi:hypothetical protein